MTITLATFEKAALLAGSVILDIYRNGIETRYKADHSPVTLADEKAEAIILRELAKAFPDIPVVAEESVAAGRIPDISSGRFILVDPLDGTKEFISGREEFTVNIGLIEDGMPTAGVIYAPALNVMYCGAQDHAEKLTISAEFRIAARETIEARVVREPPVCVASRSHLCNNTQAFISTSGACDIRSIGSSLKFCLLAEGTADLYPRFQPTMEWDTAAGDAILRAAGGSCVNIDGTPLTYGKRTPANQKDFGNPDFIAWGRRHD